MISLIVTGERAADFHRWHLLETTVLFSAAESRSLKKTGSL